MQFKQSGWETVDSTKVGVFIRVPEELAVLFPDISATDPSPRHITFLIVGDVRGHEAVFLKAVEETFRDNIRRKVHCQFNLRPDFFVNPVESTLTWYTPASFNYHLGQIRTRLIDRLTYDGFDVADNFPQVWHPHTTLAYGSGLDSKAPAGVGGGFDFGQMEVWGLKGDHPHIVKWVK